LALACNTAPTCASWSNTWFDHWSDSAAAAALGSWLLLLVALLLVVVVLAEVVVVACPCWSDARAAVALSAFTIPSLRTMAGWSKPRKPTLYTLSMHGCQ
jgi:hypothetical protein